MRDEPDARPLPT